MRSIALVLVVVCAACFMVGCGDDGGSDSGDTKAPTVTLTNPAGGATGVSPNRPIWISFSESMDEATLDSIYVEGATVAEREYHEDTHSVTLWTENMLEAETEYDIRIAAAVTDRGGNQMDQDYIFSFTTAAFACANLYDPFEPNDDTDQASPVELDTWYRLVPSCGSESRHDYYQFTLSDTAKATVILNVVDADTTHMRWGISFYRGNGASLTQLGTGHFLIPFTQDFYQSLLPGTYIALLYKYDDDQYSGLYNFMIETSEPCADDQYEDNDFEEEATPITAGLYEDLRACYLDKDLYSIDLAQGKTLRVTMSEVEPSGGSRALRIWGPGTSVGGVNQTEPRVEMALAGQAGTFYIYVQWWRDNVTYDLNVEVLD